MEARAFVVKSISTSTCLIWSGFLSVSNSVLNFAMMCAQLFFHQVFSFSAQIYDEQIEVLNHVGQSMSTKRVVICGVARTPIGSFMGTLSSISAVDLGIMAVKELCSRVGFDASSGIVDDVYFGQVLQAGSGQNPARQVTLGAGLPITTSASTINKVCGSSLEAAMLAANSILAGKSKVVVAGGMESMSNAPQLLMGQRKGKKMGDSNLIDSMIHDGLWDVYNDIHMGNTGETVAQENDITRNDSDNYAVRSHQRAATAWDSGWFDWETFTVVVPKRRGEDVKFTRDEGIKSATSNEILAKLRPVFNKEGQVTAGNASTLNDGASAILLADEDTAKENGWEIIAYIDDYCTTGVEPHRVMSAPIPAIRTLLERNQLEVLDVDIYEHNEAFASASCAVAKEIGIPDDRFNLHGGAISLGHPLGSSGTRCLITLLGIMRRTNGKSGIVTLCLGGGNAVAMLVSRT
jgi:acetyl-CoA C-acetyltransferase